MLVCVDRAVTVYNQVFETVVKVGSAAEAESTFGDVAVSFGDEAVADEMWAERLVRAHQKGDAIAAGGKMTPSRVARKPMFLPEELTGWSR